MKRRLSEKFKNVEQSTLGKDQVKMIYIKESGEKMKNEVVKYGSIYV